MLMLMLICTDVCSPFVASTYRRMAEYDEGWFLSQTGAEDVSNRPESEPANYSCSIDVTSFMSLGSVFSSGNDSDRDEGEGGEEHYDSFDCPSSSSSKDGTTDTKEEMKFLDRMESSIFSFENKQNNDGSTTTNWESDDESEYFGEPRDENYFGEGARASFFALYHK
jgi:hypothetical protein